MKNIMLKLKYDGTNYCGWQKQANGVTIQGVLEECLFALFSKEGGGEADGCFVKIIGCSRTDAGVHAREYICNFHTQSEHEPNVILRALNAKLPKNIAVLDAEYVADNFNARYDVKSKTYVYQIWNSRQRDPFLQNYAYHIKTPLDVDKMNLAAAKFIGEHDFSAFTTVEGAEKNTIRTITDCCVAKADNLVVITVEGQSFLHNMVRIIAGTIINVGLGKLPHNDISGIILSGKRENSGATAPAKGLFLESVKL